MQPAAPEELVRGQVPHPARPGSYVAFFADLERALRHLGDHLLTAPECQGWALVLPALADHVDPHDAEARAAFFRRARSTHGVSAQAVFDLYREASARTASDAFLLNWHASDGPTTAALGTSGVLVLIDGPSVVTVYLPGQGDPAAVRASGEAGAGCLGRERQLMRRPEHRGRRERQEQERREARRSPEERLYYDVFRPAVQFLRKRYHRSWTLDGERRHDDALLKKVLPPMSRLGLEGWQGCRAQVAAGGGS
jgi:hypothetical protein